MKSIDVSAATIEEAINDGLAKLGCSISDCKVQVLQEGAKGLFGLFGSKPATVRLTLLRSEEEEKNDFDDFSINLRDTMDAAPEAASRNNAPKKKAAAPERRTVPAPRPAEKQPAPEAVQQPEAPKPSPAPERQKNSDVLERFKNAPLPGTAAKPAEPAQTSMYVFRPAHARQHEKARPARREGNAAGRGEAGGGRALTPGHRRAGSHRAGGENRPGATGADAAKYQKEKPVCRGGGSVV